MMLHEFHVIGIGAIASVVALLWRDRRDQDDLFRRVPAPRDSLIYSRLRHHSAVAILDLPR